MIKIAASVVISALLFFTAGVYADQHYPQIVPELGAPTGTTADLSMLRQAITLIEGNYYHPATAQQLTYAALRGMVGALHDRFSFYFSPTQYRMLEQQYQAQYSGIGAYVGQSNGYPEILGIIPGSPAAAAHLRQGELIEAIDGVSAKGISVNQAAQRIQGSSGTKVTLTILDNGHSLSLTLVRQHITVPTVVWRRFPDGILYIRIYSFDQNTAADFASVLSRHLSGSKGMVLDLRDNPGGFVNQAVKVIGEFVGSGVAVRFENPQGVASEDMVGSQHLALHIPVVVLVNQNSASAAEITAGALLDHHRAVLVGERTFGKGTVQEDFPLLGGSGGDLHMTIMHWFTPNGYWVQGRGLKPNIVVALPSPKDEYNLTQPQNLFRDTQLQTAISYLVRTMTATTTATSVSLSQAMV